MLRLTGNAHGTRWFAHRPYARISCDSKPTDARHEAAVAAVSAMARERGWEVETEACTDDWRADVLCRRPKANVRVAFQVELLKREWTDILADGDRLAAAGIAVWWIFPERAQCPDTLPHIGRVRTGGGSNTAGESAAFAARVLDEIERAFVTANGVLSVLKSAGWAHDTIFDCGIPTVVWATYPADGHRVDIRVGDKADLGFAGRGAPTARSRNAEAQKRLVDLFQARLERGIELWWPGYPSLDAETFRPLCEAIQAHRGSWEQRTSSCVGDRPQIFVPTEPSRQGTGKSAFSSPIQYFEPMPDLMAAAERSEQADRPRMNEWSELRASHIRRAAETVMSAADAAKWMDTRNLKLGGHTPHEAAVKSSQALEACEVALGIRDPITLAKNFALNSCTERARQPFTPTARLWR